MDESRASPDTDIVTDGGEEGAYELQHQSNEEPHSSSWSSCTKNPKHEDFIPLSEFKKEDIPRPYNDEFYYKFILAMAAITVRLKLKFISIARPNGYVFAQQRGKNITVMGSGCAIGIEENYNLTKKCPCPQCKDSEHEQQKAWFIRIRTANHLIFDTKEAENTTVDVFYDNRKKKEDMRTLYGVEVVIADVKEDICEMICVTHDEAVYIRLKENLITFDKLQKEKFATGAPAFPRIDVVVSHPHGTSKQVSFQRVPSFLATISPEGKRNIEIALCLAFMDRGLGVIRSVKSEDSLKADGTEEAELTNLEINVRFPDGEVSLRNIWLWNEPVKKSKEFLLKVGGIKNWKPEDFTVVLNMPSENAHEAVTKLLLKDDEKMSSYKDELTQALSLEFWLNKGSEPGHGAGPVV